MARLNYVFLILIVYSSAAHAKENEILTNSQRNSVDSIYWLGYGGILTIGYQRLFHNRFGLNISAASIALLHEDLRDGFSFPIHASLYPTGEEHRMFIDLGVNLITKGKSNPLFDFYDGFNMPYIVGMGYNYHPKEGGLFGKLGASLFIYEPASKPDSLTTGMIWGIALGKAF